MHTYNHLVSPCCPRNTQAISLSIFQCKLIKYVNKSNKCKQTTCWDIEKLKLKILQFIYFFKYINT